MMEPAVEMSPQSFVTKTLGFFMKLTVTRFVSFCPTWLRTCEVWSISLIFTVEEKTLIFCAAPVTQPAKVTSMDESASQAPPSHSTSFFSSVTINSQPLWLYYFPISFPLLFLSFPPLLQSLPVSSWFSPSSTLTPRFTLSSITWRLYFLKLRGKRQQGDPRHHGKSNADLDSRLTSYTLSCGREELQRAVGEAGVWSPGEHQRTFRNTRTSTQPETVPERDWKSVKGKAWWEFSAAVSHSFHT